MSTGGDALTTPSEAPRARWGSNFEFTTTCIGYAVGLGNFWRFPYLCYQYGGGAFLVPYTLTLIIIGIPVFLLELAIGQKFQLGAIQLWRSIHPALGGLGTAGTIATFIVALYYNVIVAWALWYLGNSFSYPLPWSDERGGARHFWEETTLHCRPDAITDAAAALTGGDFGNGTLNGTSDSWLNMSSSCPVPNATQHTSAPSCMWDGVSFPQHPGLADTGGLVWPLVGCLVLGWFLIWLCVCKGIASIGKVAMFTAIFPVRPAVNIASGFALVPKANASRERAHRL